MEVGPTRIRSSSKSDRDLIRLDQPRVDQRIEVHPLLAGIRLERVEFHERSYDLAQLDSPAGPGHRNASAGTPKNPASVAIRDLLSPRVPPKTSEIRDLGIPVWSASAAPVSSRHSIR